MPDRLQVVIDTNVLLSALRSKKGASFRLLSLVGTGRFDVHLSVPLVLEYEATIRRVRWKGKPSTTHVSDILDYLCMVGKATKIHFLWRPREQDPNDDMILELAVAGDCDCIVTFNVKDFTEAQAFGIEVLTPQVFLKRIGETE